MYTIRYHHRTAQTAPTLLLAYATVGRELRAVRGSAFVGMFHVTTDDGVYFYGSLDELQADDTGAEAFAVVSRDEGNAA